MVATGLVRAALTEDPVFAVEVMTAMRTVAVAQADRDKGRSVEVVITVPRAYMMIMVEPHAGVRSSFDNVHFMDRVSLDDPHLLDRVRFHNMNFVDRSPMMEAERNAVAGSANKQNQSRRCEVDHTHRHHEISSKIHASQYPTLRSTVAAPRR